MFSLNLIALQNWSDRWQAGGVKSRAVPWKLLRVCRWLPGKTFGAHWPPLNLPLASLANVSCFVLIIKQIHVNWGIFGKTEKIKMTPKSTALRKTVNNFSVFPVSLPLPSPKSWLNCWSYCVSGEGHRERPARTPSVHTRGISVPPLSLLRLTPPKHTHTPQCTIHPIHMCGHAHTWNCTHMQ